MPNRTNRQESTSLLLRGSAIIVILLLTVQKADSNCNKVFESTGTPLERFGVFEAPSRTDAKPYKVSLDERGNYSISTNTNETLRKPPIHCIYKFIGGADERVALNFSSFRLRGDEPECLREYVDIFVKFKSDDDLTSALSKEPPNGRFCTTVLPRRMVSLYNMIVLVIYSELEPPINRKSLFTGTYDFVKTKAHDQIGPPVSGTLCNHTIYSNTRREGEFQSVTYPGVYVKGLRCSYRFVGEPGQRVRLEFLDIDVYSGGTHCPLDSVKVFDGSEETDPIINTICGSHKSLIIYSTRETILMTFFTLERETDVQNRGFSAYFEFSDKFYDTSFIKGQNAKHIRGSECDQRIISQKGNKGIIVAPESKNHPNAICRYLFEGLQTSLDYEKVFLKFTEFDLRTPRIVGAITTTTTTTTTTAASTGILSILQDSSLSNTNSTEQCTDNYLRIYTSEQKPDQKQDPNDYDYVFCSSELPQNIESDAASLLMEYNSGSLGGYFKAEYAFIVDFRIPGQQASPGCNYIYKSDLMRSGTFNSPRHPSWYISDLLCTYTFLTKADETLLLQFGAFKMQNPFNEKVLGFNDTCRGEDSVQILELTLDSLDSQKVLERTEIGTYCGTTTPGPILSYKPVRVNFFTNKDKVNYGFSAIYNFYPIPALNGNEFVTNCGGQIQSSQYRRSGNFSSPETYRPETYEKRNHICSWNITARQSYRIALDFSRFELEGSPLVRGCMTASVRIQTGRSKIPIEICGSLNPANKTAHQFVSDNEWLSLTFISTKQASGSNGFDATWTEIKRAN